jgi:hypothetical protein
MISLSLYSTYTACIFITGVDTLAYNILEEMKNGFYHPQLIKVCFQLFNSATIVYKCSLTYLFNPHICT